MANKTTIRNFIGRVRVESGAMGIGSILVVEDERMGDFPLATVQMPFKSAAENRAVAEYLADAWNAGMVGSRKAGN